MVFITRTQPNWRLHLGAAVGAIVTGFALGLSFGELSMVVLAIGLVLTAEAANTAVEATVDALEQPPSMAAKHAKDAAAASVLVAALTSLAVAGLLFGPKLLAMARP
jgi:diacylglycerol kinase